jgi:putative hemolysin
VNIAILLILLCASAFFSGSETAFLSIGKVKLKQFEHMGSAASARVVKLLSDVHKLLITILVGNTIVNIAATAVFTNIFLRALGEKGVLLSMVSMTLLLLVFGEVTPKVFALSNPVRVTFFASLPLRVSEVLFAPLRSVLSGVSNGIVRMMGIRVTKGHGNITEEEIRSLFSISKKKGVVKEKEKDMIEGVLEFKESDAADIMTPRIGVSALDLSCSREDVVAEIKSRQYSRFPVYMHSLDNVVGILHAKNVLLKPETEIKDLINRPYFAPESMKVDDLLQELQRKHMHMAIVTDEYGVTSGIVTIEDILEEIVGEIRDEFDFEQPNIVKIDQNTFEVGGQTHIAEVNESLGLGIETDEVDTIGGYVVLCIGKMPQAGDTVRVGGYSLHVNDVSKNRVTTLTVRKVK